MFIEGKLFRKVGEGSGGGGGAVDSVNGKTGTVVLGAKDVHAVPQYTTMPTADSTNVEEIAQFAGNQPTVPASATISQTTGSGLTDLSVNLDTFVAMEQPSGDETVNFVAASVNETIDPTQFEINTATIEIDPTIFLSMKTSIYGGDWANVVRIYFSYDGDNDSFGAIAYDADNNELGSAGGFNPTMWGISVVSGTLPSSGSWGTNLYYTPAGIQWAKGGDTVTLSDYGISFTGDPADGDVLTVVYTAMVQGYDTGYFYVNTPTYSDSSATISQTTGSGLTDLAVDVATFESAEQPSGDENVAFTASVTPDTSVVVEATPGLDYTFDGAQVMDYFNSIWGYHDANMNDYVWGTDYIVYTNDGWVVSRNSDGSSPWNIVLPTGVTINSTPNVNDYIEINNTMGGTTWTKGGNTVTLADYGISFTGAPTDGDVLTVAYTAPAISGYAWEQIDVQPSSGGGQTIEYTDVDYVYGTDPSEMSLYFEFENLPTGDYYFYVKSLKNTYTAGGDTFAYQTNKVSFHWDSSWNGNDPYPFSRAILVSPVFDGDFVGSTDRSNTLVLKGISPIQIAFNYDAANKFAIKLSEGLLSNTNYFYADKAAVYKVSKLYGGATPVSLTVNKVGRYDNPTGYDTYTGGGNNVSIVPDVTLPDKKYQQLYSVSTMAGTDNILVIYGGSFQTNNSESDILQLKFSCKYGEFIGNVIYNLNGQTEQQILKATGPFANSRFYVNLNNVTLYLSLDNAAFAALQDQNEDVYGFGAIFGSNGGAQVLFVVTQDSTMVLSSTVLPFAVSKPTYVLDTPTIHEYKGIVQYVGETDANYTNGYFYEADGTVVTVPASITCTETSSTGTTITCTGTDVDDLISAIMAQTGWQKSTVLGYLGNTGYNWEYDADGNTLYWGPYGGVPSSWIQYFTFSPAVTSGFISWTTSNVAFTHDELQNAVWLQKDVQPAGGLTNTATGNNSLGILGSGTNKDNCVEVGVGATASDSQATVVGKSASGGYDSAVYGYYATGVMYSAVYGYNATANYQDGIAYGREAVSNAIGAIQIGKGTNSDAGTLKIGQTTDGTNWANIELLTAAGLIPVERLAAITGLADGNYKLRLTISSGVPTLSWVAE